MNQEQPPGREFPTDDELIAEGIDYARENEVPIPDSTARRIAMQWHGGQASELYSFGSSGAIRKAELFPELLQNHLSLDLNTADGIVAATHLDYLVNYLAVHGDRPPVYGWELTTQDGRPAVQQVDSLTFEQLIGTYDSELELAHELLASTGLHKAIHEAVRSCGMSLMPYVHIDEAAYAQEMHKDVRFVENPDGSVTAYWRL